ncbi:hypothetical protein F5Y18DRAFT_438094 [Xylariaceae sp. FL1019]|nr:hypothetical protein F5Y18DRAFT_438094 [Xylariaceae sp. FL1019]
MREIPLEITQAILQELDPASLKNVALSCRVFYEAFKGAERLIVHRSLLTCIDDAVLPEAYRLHKSWGLCPPNDNQHQAAAFAANDCFDRGLPKQFQLSDTMKMAKFHEFVRAIADTAAHDALQRERRLTASGQPTLATPEEVHRFQRALYRFQLYCNVVGAIRYDGVEEAVDWFFTWATAIENEQLACIHDFLVRVIAKSFNSLVDHDIDWGRRRILYIDNYRSSRANAVMAKGLELIYELIQAFKYAHPHDVLDSVVTCGRIFASYNLDGSQRVYEFLYEDLKLWGTAADTLSSQVYQDFTVSDLADTYDYCRVRGTENYTEPDQGPEAMWTHLTRDLNIFDVVNQPELAAERLWAFPCWNLSRLEAGGLLLDPSLPKQPGFDHEKLGLEQYSDAARILNLQLLWLERSNIAVLNGWGYYNHQDLRYVQWNPTTLTRVAEWYLGEAERRAFLAEGRSLANERQHIAQLGIRDPYWMVVMSRVRHWSQGMLVL